MKLGRERQGEIFIFFETMFWGLFPVITILSYNKLSPLVSLFWSTLFAAVFFAWVLLGNIPTSFQLLSFIPMFFGVMLLSKHVKQKG